ncbi:MAG: Mur ligase family protein, partial [Emcibacteraceae bacterium]|nr:Mur ligase family protein [Emcibacteraceae bacterium]
MKLAKVINNNDERYDVEISGITADSRQVQPGFMFVALPGLKFNGADFIEGAIKAGAVAILCIPSAKTLNEDVIWLLEDSPSAVFPNYVSRFFTSKPEQIAAVTGTNGKTSVAFFTQQIWKQMGIKAASVGTLGVNAEGYHKETGLTTPDPVLIHQALKELDELNIDHVVFEASSHGLDQHRLDGIDISAAAFTNLTHDHLDYHKTTEEYFNAKKRLFSEILKP